MAAASPPKPWERQSGAAGNGGAPSLAPGTTTLPSTSSSGAPAIPERPSSLSSVVNRTATNFANPAPTLANRPLGSYSSPYGFSSPYGAYSSPYSRFGTGMYGGGMYGSGMFGGGMYGGGMYGGMGMGGMMGPQGDPNDPNSMTQNFAQSTQATFQIIESIVGAFGGFAQMLESTYMATQSSFFAMVSVAEQFGNLRQTLGSVLGIYTLLRWLRTLFAKLTGRPPPADATSLTPSAFAAFASGGTTPPAVGPDGRPIPRPSKKPFVVFLLAVFGLPYLMGKLIRALAKSQEESLAAQQQQNLGINPQESSQSLDPSKLDFCKVLYDFPPEEAVANGTFDVNLDLQVKKGDLVAVLDKSDPNMAGQAGAPDSAWWRCRARNGRMGYLPAVYLATIQKRPQLQQQHLKQIEDGSVSRANSMPGKVETVADSATPTMTGHHSRAQTLSSAAQLASRSNSILPQRHTQKGSGGPEGLEKFQKAWANDK